MEKTRDKLRENERNRILAYLTTDGKRDGVIRRLASRAKKYDKRISQDLILLRNFRYRRRRLSRSRKLLWPMECMILSQRLKQRHGRNLRKS